MPEEIKSNIENIPRGEDFWTCEVCRYRDRCNQAIEIDGMKIGIEICDVFMEKE